MVLRESVLVPGLLPLRRGVRPQPRLPEQGPGVI